MSQSNQHDHPNLGDGPAVLAFDVGGTDIKAGIVDDEGTTREIRRVATRASVSDPAGTLMEQLLDLTADFSMSYPDIRTEAIGVGVPGIFDDMNQVGVLSTNLGWENAPFGELAEQTFQLPAVFGHDVRTAALAERVLGAASDCNNAVVLSIGTGIAGALFLDGRSYTGDGFAGEFGHVSQDPHGLICECGGRGCVEASASAAAIARAYTEITGEPVSGAREVSERAQNGDTAAEHVWSEAVNSLAFLILSTSAIIAPEKVIIGGGLAEAGDHLFVPLRARVDALATFHLVPHIGPAHLGADAGVIGAALIARASL